MSPLTSNAETKYSTKASEHPIESVTVFRSSNAQVVRTLTLDLKAGRNDIEITGLSSSIDPESLRISGLGDARLADVVCVVDPGLNRPEPLRKEEESEAILEETLKIRDLKFEKEAREGEIEMLLNYGKSLGGTAVTPEQVTDFAEKTLAKQLATSKIVRQLDNQIEELERNIERNKIPTEGKADATATITVIAQEGGLVVLVVSYLVRDARWSPTYDLRATSESGTPSSSVSLHYRVHLSQSTGEHWNDTSLILSTTATDALNAGIPEPKALSIQTTAQVRTRQTARKSTSVRSRMMLRSVEYGLEEEEEEDIRPIHEGVAIVSKSPLSVTYTVDGKTTIPSDGESHKVSVAQLPFEAAISCVTVPRQGVLAYLQCEVKNTTDYHLLPGQVSVFMNDGYVSRTYIPDINTGDMFRCTLGVDTSTRVSYNLTSTSETSPASSFVEQYKTVTYTSTTTINNRHTGEHPISIIEKSSVPVAPADDKRIKVFLKKPEGLAESEDGVEVDLRRRDGFKVKWSLGGSDDSKGGKKEGKFVWLGNVRSGDEVVLVSEWEVRAPVDVEWTESSD